MTFGLLGLLRDSWAPLPASTPWFVGDYMEDLRHTVEVMGTVVRLNTEWAQAQQKQQFN